MNTAAMIDYMLVRYRNTESGARAKSLKWLNQAQREIWYDRNWWFRMERVPFEFLAANSEYNVPAGVLEVRELYGETGAPLVRCPAETFDRNYLPHGSIGGAPLVWSPVPQAAPGVLRVRVWPTPVADASGMVLYEMAVSDLSDSAANYTAIPEQHQHILPIRALRMMAVDENKPQMAEEYAKEEGPLYEAMVRAEAQHRGVVR